MKTIKKLLKLTKDNYFMKHLLIINPLLPEQVTPKEAEILGAFMSLEGDIANDPFGTTGRKIVRDKTGVSPGGLGNHLRELKEKGFIYEEDKTLKIVPALIPNKKEQLYQFKLEIQENV